jgi:hypothetical protein
VKALILGVIIAACAHAQDRPLNFEEWNTRSDEQQLRYLSQCVDRFAGNAQKNLGDKARRTIIDYFRDKAPGSKYSEGTAKLLDSLGILIRFKAAHPLVNLSSVDVCAVVMQVISDKLDPHPVK